MIMRWGRATPVARSHGQPRKTIAPLEWRAPSAMSTFPTQARVVIIGGGIMGCSTAYHLAKLGWKDVVLLEQGRLSGGTTWHAAGLVGQLRSYQNLTRLIRYSTELYSKLEAETGPRHRLEAVRLALGRAHRGAHGAAAPLRRYGQRAGRRRASR